VQWAVLYAEGADAFDVDGDGKRDLLAGTTGSHMKAVTGSSRCAWAKSADGSARGIQAGKIVQIPIAPGDGSGPLMYCEWAGNPVDESWWKGRYLLNQELIHGHTLDLGDVDGDGRLDVFSAEMPSRLMAQSGSSAGEVVDPSPLATAGTKDALPDSIAMETSMSSVSHTRGGHRACMHG
jgi:hypothetical protein